MSAFVGMLGSELATSSGVVNTMDTLQGKVVGLYFSAHWCPPCRGFTPVLAEAYTKSLAQKGLEVVFVSSDQDEASFQEYFAEMPWKALPYSKRDLKEKLSKKFKVRGIPTFVVLDSDGSLITTDGRSALAKDLEGEQFPWRPQPPKPVQELLGTEFLTKSGIVGKEAVEGKVLGLYFSAHWCPPCRGFTPQLAEWYKKIQPSLPNFEVIFISSDRSEEDFQGYYNEMPWIALPWADRKRKEELSENFEVSGIPTFIIVDKDGTMITTKGRGIPASDPEGKQFPWHPSPVKDVANDSDELQENPSLVALADGTDDATRKSIKDALETAAKAHKAKAKEDQADFQFFFGGLSSNGILNAIRRLAQQPPLLKKHEHPLTQRTDRPQWQCDGCRARKQEVDVAYNCEGCDFDFCESCNSAALDKVEGPVTGLLVDFDNEGFCVADVDFTKPESILSFVDKFHAGSLQLSPFKS